MCASMRGAGVGYHPGNAGILTRDRERSWTLSGGQFDWGGRLQKSTEAFEGCLSTEGNRAQSIKA